MKIFGREPAAIIGFIEAVLAMVLSFGWFDLSQEKVGLIMAVVTAAFGVYTAYVTSETLLGAVIGFAKAALALGAVYGLSLSDQQTGCVIALITMSFGLYQRTQTSPLNTPSFKVISPEDTVTPKAA